MHKQAHRFERLHIPPLSNFVISPTSEVIYG
ncbi:hypothetical protein RLDS_22695 [Sphingobium lactosutens DS20]|uniref:Uncharacterized protein n=1 Tax=Sphingobium lactosutens DS20 TaxID=1331060 RepID=T0HIH2_9SPHN|nr:hypothetical protein RLDS_22695 [Sphingobium lactosutens DS20]